MTETEALELVSDALQCDATIEITETEYEPPYAGIWVTMADGSRWIVRVERQVEDK